MPVRRDYKKGHRFGRLTLIKELESTITYDSSLGRNRKNRFVLCLCDCGVVKRFSLKLLTRGKTKSCGCLSAERAHNGNKSIINNIAINDYNKPIFKNGKNIYSYDRWCNIIKRCYNKDFLIKNPSYNGCSVCDEWLYFSNFKKWFDANYNPDTMQGWHVDKDILVKGNKVYSPDTCCLVPNEINQSFKDVKNPNCGIRRNPNNKNVYIVQFSRKYIGSYKDIKQAKEVYNQVKVNKIMQLADKWKDKIADNVYQALCNYKVDNGLITERRSTEPHASHNAILQKLKLLNYETKKAKTNRVKTIFYLWQGG